MQSLNSEESSTPAEVMRPSVGSKRFDTEVAPCFYNWRELFPELEVLLKNIEIIKEESKSIGQVNSMYYYLTICVVVSFSYFQYEYLIYNGSQQWIPWPEDHFTLGDDVENSKDWTVFPLLHTFPAYCPENSKWVGSTCARCPETVKLLKSIPTLRTALFSRLGPGTKVKFGLL